MDGGGIRAQFSRVLQGRNGCSIVMLLHVCVAQPKEDDCRAGSQIRGLTKCGDSLLQITAIFGVAWFLGSALMGFLYTQSLLALVIFSVAIQLAALPVFVIASRFKTNPS